LTLQAALVLAYAIVSVSAVATIISVIRKIYAVISFGWEIKALARQYWNHWPKC
jgi:hypothetical protein